MELPETAATTVKVVSAIDHLKNNRVEYLLLIIVSHFLGITDIIISQIHGVC